MLEYLTSKVRRSLEADFAAILDPEAPWPLAMDGEAPADVDLVALAHRVIPPDEMDDHLAITDLIRARVVLVVGRPDLVFRPGERLRISTMAELADHRWGELTSRSISH